MRASFGAPKELFEGAHPHACCQRMFEQSAEHHIQKFSSAHDPFGSCHLLHPLHSWSGESEETLDQKNVVLEVAMKNSLKTCTTVVLAFGLGTPMFAQTNCSVQKHAIIAGSVTNTGGTGKTTHVPGAMKVGANETISTNSWKIVKLDGGGVKSLCVITGTEGSPVQINGVEYTRIHTIKGYAHAETGSGGGRIGMRAWANCEIRAKVCKQ